MSAEGKKKRGEAGQAHARANPHRINGWPVDWAARRMGAFSAPPAASSGSTTMRGLVGGMLAAKLGYSMHGHEHLYNRMMEHAEPRCTHPLLRGEEPLKQAAE